MPKTKKLLLFSLLLCAAMFLIGCSTDDADSNFEGGIYCDLDKTKWVGISSDDDTYPIVCEFGLEQSDPASNGSATPTKDAVYIRFAGNNACVNATYIYDLDRGYWTIYDTSDDSIVMLLRANDDDTLESNDNYIFKTVGTSRSNASFTALEGTVWCGLNPVNRPMVWMFGKTNGNAAGTKEEFTVMGIGGAPTPLAGTVLVSFGQDGTRTPYDFTYSGTAGATTGGSPTPGDFTVSGDFTKIDFSSFYGYGKTPTIYRLK